MIGVGEVASSRSGTREMLCPIDSSNSSGMPGAILRRGSMVSAWKMKRTSSPRTRKALAGLAGQVPRAGCRRGCIRRTVRDHHVRPLSEPFGDPLGPAGCEA